MNCAIPSARWPLRVTGPTASDWNLLSCQITRAKNSSGRPCALAADSIIRHIASRVSSSPACSPVPRLWGIASSSTLGLANLPEVSADAVATGPNTANPTQTATLRPTSVRMVANVFNAKTCLQGGDGLAIRQ